MLMRRLAATSLLCLAAFGLVGCGEEFTPPPPPKGAPIPGPHQGTAYALPGEMGYVEVVNDPVVVDRSPQPTSLVVYFLNPDAKTALPTLPADLKFRPDSKSKRGQPVSLKADPKADDSVGQARFASPSGPYQLEELRGEVSGKIEGKAFSISFSPR